MNEVSARNLREIQLTEGVEGVISYVASRNIEGVTKFTSLASFLREIRLLLAEGAKIEEIRIFGATVGGHHCTARILPREMQMEIRLNLDALELGAGQKLKAIEEILKKIQEEQQLSLEGEARDGEK